MRYSDLKMLAAKNGSRKINALMPTILTTINSILRK